MNNKYIVKGTKPITRSIYCLRVYIIFIGSIFQDETGSIIIFIFCGNIILEI